jgi:GT2 family glycosyltransferase
LKYPLVSIVILDWNGENTIRECLSSVMNLNYPSFEVIVVDNASSDKSPRIVSDEFPTTKQIINKTNLGFAGGVNVGIRQAKGDFVAILNNDAMLDRNWLAPLVESMHRYPKIGIIGGPVLFYGKKGVIWSAGNKVDLFTGLGWSVGRGKSVNQSSAEMNDIDYVNFCAALIRREVFDRIGLLNENYFVGWEDADFGIFAAAAGYDCSIVPSSLAWHKTSYSRRKAPIKSYYNTAKAFFRFCMKSFPTKYLLSTLFWQLFVMPEIELFIFKKSPIYIVQRFRAFFSNLGQLHVIIIERNNLKRIGKLPLRNRLREVLHIALKDRNSGRVPFM